jgi:hypothetical protein
MEFKEPVNGFRFIFSLPGIPEFLIRSVKNISEKRLEITYHWTNDQDFPCEPTDAFGVAVLSMLDEKGVKIKVFNISYDGFEILPIQLDYAEKISLPKLILENVSVERV